MRIDGKQGFSLTEIVVALVLSGVIITGILRVYLATVRSYNTQDIIADMNMNGTYACKRISDEIMQAGANLPDAGLVIITVNGTNKNDVTLKINPDAAIQRFSTTLASTTDIPVDSAKLFAGSSIVYTMDTTKTVNTYTLNTGYNTSPYSGGIDLTSNPNRIRLTTPVSITVGTCLFASQDRRYFMNGTNLCQDNTSNIISENIDSLAIIFYTKANATTTTWTDMQYATVYVRARSSVPDPGKRYTDPKKKDHYLRLERKMDVLIRAKVTF